MSPQAIEYIKKRGKITGETKVKLKKDYVIYKRNEKGNMEKTVFSAEKTYLAGDLPKYVWSQVEPA